MKRFRCQFLGSTVVSRPWDDTPNRRATTYGTTDPYEKKKNVIKIHVKRTGNRVTSGRVCEATAETTGCPVSGVSTRRDRARIDRETRMHTRALHDCRKTVARN